MVPDKYIAQLIDDIVAAHKNDNDPIEPSENIGLDIDDMANYFKDVEDYLSFDIDEGPTFGEVVGLDVIQFPEVEKLNKDQINELYSAFIDLLQSYNVTLDIPDEVSIEQKYILAVSVLNDAMYMPDMGGSTWDFCSHDVVDCPYGEHCRCIEFEREFDLNIEDARKTLEDIIDSCESIYEDHGTAKLVISEAEEFEFNLLCMYIAGGIDYIPAEVYQNGLELMEACEKLIQLFGDDLELKSLFDDISEYKVHFNLQVLLSLNVEKYENNTFYVEPYYIENSRIFKGISPTYTPEELMRIIEGQGDELPF